MLSIIDYIEQNRDEFLKDLFALLKIPSVSTLPEHKEDMLKAAEWLAVYLKRIGLRRIEIVQTDKHPLVYGESLGVKNAPTILLYSHYDVQPPDPLAQWKTNPFNPIIKDGKIFCRGVADDKSMTLINLFALKYFFQNGGLPFNVKVILEGEEEIASPSLEKYLEQKQNQKKLACDLVFVSDSPMLDENTPAIEYGLRGICYFEIEVNGPARDVHSGLYGGIIQNPANALAQIIAMLKNDQGKILIPGTYKMVRNLPQQERKSISKQLQEKNIRQETGVNETFGEKEFSLAERVGARPTLDINGIWGGFMGEGEKTIIPQRASCKISIRLVPFMKATEVTKLFTDYLKTITPKGVEVKLKIWAESDPYFLAPKSQILNLGKEALKEVFPNEVELALSGGSIPVTAAFKKRLGVDSIMIGYGLPDDNLHSPNEKMNLNQIWKGIEASVRFFEKVGKSSGK